MNNTILKLIAMRRALGLNASELAELPAVQLNKRTIATYERFERAPSQDYVESMHGLSTFYQLLLSNLNADITLHKLQAGSKLVLPYFKDFADFERVTGNDCQTYWRIWQAVVGHLVMTGVIDSINDNAPIPAGFKHSKFWLDKHYDIFDLDENYDDTL